MQKEYFCKSHTFNTQWFKGHSWCEHYALTVCSNWGLNLHTCSIWSWAIPDPQLPSKHTEQWQHYKGNAQSRVAVGSVSRFPRSQSQGKGMGETGSKNEPTNTWYIIQTVGTMKEKNTHTQSSQFQNSLRYCVSPSRESIIGKSNCGTMS